MLQPGRPRHRHFTVYVVNAGDGTVTPVDAVTRKAGKPIALPDGTHDDAGDILVAENHAMAYVLNGADEDQSVTPINTGTNKADIAVTGDGNQGRQRSRRARPAALPRAGLADSHLTLALFGRGTKPGH